MLAPYLSKYSFAPLLNILGDPGPWFTPSPSSSSSLVRSSKRCIGGVLSGKLVPRLPGFILSNPSARAHSQRADLTRLLAS